MQTGSGKSFYARKLVDEVRKLTGTDSSIKGCAPTGMTAEQPNKCQIKIHNRLWFRLICTGVAAINLGFDSVTFQHLLKIGGKNAAGKSMNTAALAKAQQDLKFLRILILDEISFVSAKSLYEIHRRLCEIFTPGDYSIAFGGIALVAMGDFYQLAPVRAEDLVSDSYTRARKNHDLQLPAEDDRERGLELWLQFRKIEFVAQNRSTDANHTAFLNHMRAHPDEPIGEEQLDILRKKILTRDDFERDAELYDAPIIVTNNKLRETLNLHIAKEFGKRKGVPVLRWRTKITGSGARACTMEELEVIARHFDCLFAIFVQDGPCYLTNNINPAKGLANGTAAIMRRLVFETQEQHDECHAQISAAAPGEVVDLIFDPIAVMVNVPSLSPTAYTDPSLQDITGLTDEDKTAGFVIPVMPSQYPEKLKIGNDSTQSVWNYYEPGFEIGFSITFHKVQGLTLKRVILCLNPEVYSLSNVTFRGLYVGLSRVRDGSHVKIFPPLMPETIREPFTHLLDLHASGNLINGLRAYNANGMWVEPDFSKANNANTNTASKNKRKSAGASKKTQTKSPSAKRKLVMPSTSNVEANKNVAKQQSVPKTELKEKIDLCDDDDDDDDDNKDKYDSQIDLDIDDDLMDGLASSLGLQQENENADRQAELEAQIQENKTRWRTRIDGEIAGARTILAELGDHHLLDFNRHHLRAGGSELSEQQCAEFWELPGVAQSLGHLRYENPDERIGLFDTPKWNHPGLFVNTCPYDSAVEEAHRLLCADANMLLILQEQAANEHATAEKREAANVILDMHRFANARMWDAARLVIVRRALFVSNVYDHFRPSCFRHENTLDLTSTVNYVDRLIAEAGASLAGFTRVCKTHCDREGCEHNLIDNVETMHGANIEFARTYGENQSFNVRLQNWFTKKRRCKEKSGYVNNIVES